MSELRELYQQVILDHNKKPRNFRKIEDADHRAAGHNPLCGDRLTLYIKLEGDVIRDIAFEGNGCAISTASASMMTEALKGKTEAQAEAIFQKFHHLVTEGEDEGCGAACGHDHEEEGPELGKLAVFAGVREFPVRVKCATLAWHTLHAALKTPDETVTTE